jgi:TRAP-type mannitol/chloroaromatic compound transport system permease large subunit
VTDRFFGTHCGLHSCLFVSRNRLWVDADLVKSDGAVALLLTALSLTLLWVGVAQPTTSSGATGSCAAIVALLMYAELSWLWLRFRLER